MIIGREGVMCKVSGEDLGPLESEGIEVRLGIDETRVRRVAEEVLEFMDVTGTTPVLLPGGGNFVRGRDARTDTPIDRSEADYRGMVGTARNAYALAEALSELGAQSVSCMISLDQRDRPNDLKPLDQYDRHVGRDYVRMGTVVVLGGGLNLPYCSTDLSAVARGGELGCIRIMKGTQAEGVYTADPNGSDPLDELDLYRTLSFEEAARRELRVLEASAWTVARDAVKVPISVYDGQTWGNMLRAYRQEIGTLVSIDGVSSYWPKETWLPARQAK
jgi:uridylate kinase